MDHYQTLRIKRTASKDDIKRAFKKLALEYHPDKNRASNAGEKFRAINEAYKILSDDRKRHAYDRFDLPPPKSESRSHHSSTSTSTSSSSHSRHRHKESRRDDNFFKGASEALSEEQKYQNELDRIRRINSDLLDEANAEIRGANRRKSSSASQGRGKPRNETTFVGKIMPDKSDEEYERIVLDLILARAKLER